SILFFSCYRAHRDLYSFPTRRSSDLTNVVAFWGYGDSTAEGGGVVPLDEAKKNLIEGYKSIVGYAEKKGCVLCLEPLNSRDAARSEEHTSELQSRENLVCRLLLEKKK